MTRSQLLVSTDQGGIERRAGGSRYSLLVANQPADPADTDADVLAAQQLRYRVFAGELGATLRTDRPGSDVDDFDPFCDHLVVREDDTGEIVGTYRMLPPERAARAGGLYADTEFDLSALDGLRPYLVETGRSCVHPDHRNGAAVGLVWAGIARYMLLSGHRYLVGCASVPLADGGARAAGVWEVLRERHQVAPARRVTPRRPWLPDAGEPPVRGALPPLLRGYVRLGAQVCGPPAHDPEFDVADFLVLLDMQRMDERYLRFFLGTTG